MHAARQKEKQRPLLATANGGHEKKRDLNVRDYAPSRRYFAQCYVFLISDFSLFFIRFVRRLGRLNSVHRTTVCLCDLFL